MNLPRYAAWLLTLLMAVLVAAQVEAASAPPAFILRPAPSPDRVNRGFFDYRAAPGAVIKDAVLVTNLGDSPLSLVLFASDVQTAANSGLVFVTAWEDAPEGTGNWLRLDSSRVTLAAGETRRVSFTLRVPEEATGEHMAGIVAQPVEAVQGEGPYQVTLVQRVAVAVRVVVEGDYPLRPHLRLDELRLESAGDEQTLVLALTNDGQRGVKGEGRVTVRSSDGDVVRAADFHLAYVLPGAAVIIRMPVTPPLSPGRYPVEVRLDAPGMPLFTARGTMDVAAATGTASQVVFPVPVTGAVAVRESRLVLWLLGVIGFLLVVVAVQAWWLHRHR